ncbi:bifunctional oligoribonuclease/PAP phosphatase NrnA [bacterium]|nr:bifunctional oligoribonuclease/PAP phosphatase NrnA [bacterium]
MDTRTAAAIKRCIEEHSTFLITSHINPDGDAISSALILLHLLLHLGKSCRVVIDDLIPKKFDYLDGVEEIKAFESLREDEDFDCVISVDASSPDRLGRVRSCLQGERAVINIDHHASNSLYGGCNYIDAGASSTAELAYAVLSLWPVPVTPEIATIVYSGVICDTGRFLFPNTTAEALDLCSRMVEKGAAPSEIAGYLYHRNSRNTIHALAAALSTLEFFFDGSVACIHLHNMMDDDIDTEGFVDHLLSIEGTEVQIFMIERDANEYRISMRSKSNIDVNEVARHFGGGGHMRAAGCVVKGSRDTIKERLLQVLGEQICTV